MATFLSNPRSRRGIRLGAFLLALVALVAVAIVAQGFDVKQTPLTTGSIWAIKASTDSAPPSYARINTGLHELETVKPVYEPSDVVQTTSSVLLLTAANTKFADVDESQPTEITSDSDRLRSTPAETTTVASTGSWVAYLSETGHVSVGTVAATAGGAAPVAVDPYAGQKVKKGAQPKRYVADAVAIGTDGILYSWSKALGTVLRYDIRTAKILGQDKVTGKTTATAFRLSAVGGDWVLVDDTGRFWSSEHRAAAATGIDAPVLQGASAAGDSAYIATASGLFTVALADGTVTRTLGAAGTSLGTPAPPTAHGSEVFAAWLPTGSPGPGTLWSTSAGRTDLAFGDTGKTTGQTVSPEFRSNGGTMVLNDSQSGWVWTVPDGKLVASSQDWSLGQAQSQVDSSPDSEATEVTEALPPVAADDSFGVRAGQLVSLPVLLNDHDPNDDVLTIVPGSVTGLADAFGTLSTTSNEQRLAVRVDPGATGSASFSYQVTDGTSPTSVSNVATVRLTVADDATNSAPVWCGVTDCVQDALTMQVMPGASSSINVLDDWVDPEGDAIYVESVTLPDGAGGSVASTPDGTVFFQAASGADASGAITLTVTVADSRGALGTTPLAVQVTASPRLTATPFAVTTRVGDHVTLDPAAHLSGVAGVASITSATTSTQDGGEVSIDTGTTMDFSATTAGSFVVRYTAQDDLNQTASIVRVTVVDPAAASLSTAPVTVFVRPKLDTTVDVFSAVSNPGGKLLLLTGATTAPSAGAYLDADVVGNSLLRVKGATADAQPGVIGVVNYTVTDGDATSASSVSGVATVVLLPDSVSKRPIAVDDAITVRAGAQIDIPVLKNDVSTDGNALVLDATSLQNPSGEGLAFVAGSSVRYLAPDKPNTYTLSYSVYSAGAPTYTGRATITITVRALGDNKPPRPPALTGRVVAGANVSIPFDDFGVDPDGDTVTLDRIETQPSSGSATISANGGSIVYTSVAGFHGPVDFSYSVKDSEGASATGTVRVGVLDDSSDQRPITFTDYVEVKQGQDNIVEVSPAANDIDPLGKPLTLTAVEPDEDVTSDQYLPLKQLIVSQDDTSIRLRAGDVVGTKTFRYTVSSQNNVNQADGYIVMKVVADAVPDVPRVTDSYVSIDDRGSFEATGLDVLSGKVAWLSGDVTALSLSLVGAPAGYSVDGSRIRGPLPTDTRLLAFKVSGKNFAGVETSSYGFLRIPGQNDIIVALKSSVAAQQVKEGASIDIDLAKLVSIPPGETLALEAGSVSASGQRQAATCALVSGTVVRYAAGNGAPYGDSCGVNLQLVGQDHFTRLLVPIAIQPLAPVPALTSASRSLNPAQDAATYQLRDMTSWAGAVDWPNLQYSVTPSGNQFDIVYDPATQTISYRALGSAPSGSVEAVEIAFTGKYAGVSRAVLYLTVGPAPTTLPKGATVGKECSIQTDAGSCTVTVIGLAGEVNIYKKDGPLSVVGIAGAPSCPGVTFTTTKTAVSAHWTGDIDGERCQVPFIVQDIRPQPQRSSGDRNGVVLFDLHGIPKAPDSVAETAYDDRTVQLAVNPGGSATAYPALAGFVVKRADGTTATTCDVFGTCKRIGGLTNGDKQTYTAFAKNTEGQLSKTGVDTIAWSYEKPTVGKVTRTSVYDQSITSASRGAVDVTITGSAASVVSYNVTGAAQPVQRTGASTTIRLTFDVGSKDVTVSPVSNVDQPPGTGPVAEPDSATVQAVGSPIIRAQGTASAGPTSATLRDFTVDKNNSDRPMQYVYIAFQGAAPTCSINQATGGGLTAVVPSGAQSPTSTIGALQTNQVYQVLACASNGYGLTQSTTSFVYTDATPEAPPGYTYTVATTPTAAGVYALTVNTTSGQPAPADFHLDWDPSDAASGTSDDYGSDPKIRVRYCRDATTIFGGTSYCTSWQSVVATKANAAYQMKVTGDTKSLSCTGGQPLSGIRVDGTNFLGSTPVVTAAVYTDINGDVVATSDPGIAPPTAVSVTGVAVKVTWTDSHVSGLDPYTWTIPTADCSPTATPSPTPTPTPTP